MFLPYGIISAFGERVAAQYPPYSHESALQHAIFGDCIDHILRTGRLIFTMRSDSRRNILLIPPDHSYYGFANHTDTPSIRSSLARHFPISELSS